MIDRRQASLLLVLPLLLGALACGEHASKEEQGRQEEPPLLEGTFEGPVPLDPATPIRRRIEPGETQDYLLELPPGQFATVRVRQQEADVRINVLGADGEVALTFEFPVDFQGVEEVELQGAESSRVHLQALAGNNLETPGTYDVWVETRPATIADTKRLRAQEAYAEGWRWHLLEAEPRLAEALNHYREAEELWRGLGDTLRQAHCVARQAEVLWKKN